MNEEIVFDTQSGISIEEQQEILSRINGIAEKNKQRLSQKESAVREKGKPAVKTAKKKSVFPVAVNIAAAVVLIAGSFLLISFNERAEVQARKRNAVSNITEKALIDEIRRETAEKISAKEREIFSISSRLEEVDAQLLLLQSGNQELTAEQLTSRETLLLLQSSYRSELALLNEQRSQILEDSRSREERFRVVIDERTKELTSGYSIELEQAVSELERLTNEQERIASIDAQVSGGLSTINELIKNGHISQASSAIAGLRNFYYNSTAASPASYQLTRAVYTQSFDLMEAIIGEISVQENSGAGADNGNAANNAADRELALENARLEETIANMQRTIDSFSSGGTTQQRRITELNNTVSNLRSQNASLTQDAAAKDRNIQTLRSENENLVTANAGLTSANAGLTSANAGLTSTNASLSSQLSEVRAANTAQEQRINDLQNQLSAIRELLRNNEQ